MFNLAILGLGEAALWEMARTSYCTLSSETRNLRMKRLFLVAVSSPSLFLAHLPSTLSVETLQLFLA